MIVEHSNQLTEGDIVRVQIGEQVLGDTIKTARSWSSRLRGLLGTVELQRNSGVWLAPCDSIHMVGMLYRIDVVFFDKDDRVIKVVRSAKLFGFYLGGKGAVSALELPARTLDEIDINLGDKVSIYRAM